MATFPPDVRWASLFVQLQREAQAAKKGLWRKSPSSASTGAVKGSGGYNCPRGYPIKGNISSKGEKIYHVPTGAYYNYDDEARLLLPLGEGCPKGGVPPLVAVIEGSVCYVHGQEARSASDRAFSQANAAPVHQAIKG